MATRRAAAQKNSQKLSKAQKNKAAKASRIEELLALSEDELKERYVAAFDKDPEEDATPEEIAEAIDGADLIDEADGKEETFFGKGDKNKAYPISSANEASIVVRQVNLQQINGGMVEVPNTLIIQTYTPKVFESLMDQNFFSESNLRIDILHDPR